MFGSSILDIAFALAFIYFILSLITTTLTELWAGLLKLRGRNLHKGIQNLLTSEVAQDFYTHPLIKSLALPKRLPSYIASNTFTLTLFDLLVNGTDPADIKALKPVRDVAQLIQAIESSSALPADLRRQLKVLLDTAEDIHEARLLVEKWYNDAMERVSGWYKRNVKFVIVCMALLVTVLSNADSLMIVNRLSTDVTVREAITTVAADYLANPPAQVSTPVPPDVQATEDDAQTGDDPAATAEPEDSATPAEDTVEPGSITGMVAEIKSLQGVLNPFEILGWSDNRDDPRSLPPLTDTYRWAMKIIGFFFTTIALTLGAPFWFDVLNRITQLRASGKAQSAPVKDPDETKGK